ncbi:U2 small nuclear ribonucleoprotein B'' [Malassezia restricta]|nr:U2 small nuclear ribonucleoprotein B'' [Malassezia restricta]AXA49966.1 U2 small nuclear ribonucleoprotein B'' [Malassezia restricta]
MSTATPNTSLYIKNINTKVKKPELRRQLYSLFGSYGKVLDVVATRADGMRGQAFIVFRDLQSATAALRALDGFEFYEKPLVLEYARTRSKATIVAEHGQEALLRPDLIYKNADGTMISDRVTFSNAQGDAQGLERKRARDGSANATGAHASMPSPTFESTERPTKAPRTDQAPTTTTDTEEKEESDDDDDAMEIGNSDDDQ